MTTATPSRPRAYGVGHYYRMSLRASGYNVSLDTDGAK